MMASSIQRAASQAPGEAAVPGVETRWMRILGIEQRVLFAGEGPPVLLLHGIGGSADEWLPVIPALARRLQVIAADAPGHGFSEKPRAFGYDPRAYVQSVLGLLDALGISQAPLVALSGGGTVALQAALERPERVSKLALIAASGLGREVSWRYRLATLPFAPRLLRHGLSASAVERFGRSMLYDQSRLPEGWVERRLRIWGTERAVEAFFQTVRMGLTLAGQRVDLSRRLGDVHQPALVIWGRHDPILPVWHGVRAAQRLPNARLHILERCGHVPIWEYPDEVTELLATFLQE